MSTERKRKVSLFDEMDQNMISANLAIATTASSVAANGSVNWWNGRPYSARYFDILKKWRAFLVWQQKEEFLQVLRSNQTLVLVSEIESRKMNQDSILNDIQQVIRMHNLRTRNGIYHVLCM